MCITQNKQYTCVLLKIGMLFRKGRKEKGSQFTKTLT